MQVNLFFGMILIIFEYLRNFMVCSLGIFLEIIYIYSSNTEGQ
jgi:hypothetical protein